MEVLAALGIMGALWYGGHQVIAGAMTPGDFFSFTAAVALLYGPVRQLSRIMNTVQQSTGAVERVFEVLDTPPAIADRPGARAFGTLSRALGFEGVSFRYAGAPGPAERRGVQPRLTRHLRHARRRARRAALVRAAPAARHRARLPERSADPDPGRGDLGPRRRERVHGAAGAGRPHARPHGARHRAPPRHRAQRRPHRRRPRGAHRRGGPPRRADRPGRRLPPPLRAADGGH